MKLLRTPLAKMPKPNLFLPGGTQVDRQWEETRLPRGELYPAVAEKGRLKGKKQELCGRKKQNICLGY